MRETWLYNEPVLNPLLPKAVIANCLCAVSQGSLSCADCTFCYPGNPLFMSLKADHLVLGTAEHLCAKMSYCRKERNYGGKGGKAGLESEVITSCFAVAGVGKNIVIMCSLLL